MNLFTVAICTYNRAERLPGLVAALRLQQCPVPFEILVVDNNSSDETQAVLKQLAGMAGTPLRSVAEPRQGISHARNRAIDACMVSQYMAFLDDDELPAPGWLDAAWRGLAEEGADCVGGRIRVAAERPRWLGDELLGFLGEVDYGGEPFWIRDASTPVWSGNVAYRTALFADAGLRFDQRYNRAGKGIGGGEDALMFRALLAREARLRYRPDMAIEHLVEPWRMRRSYFLRLHFAAGRKFGEYESGEYDRAVLGVPPFMLGQALRHWVKAAAMWLRHQPGTLRQAMNGAYAVGTIVGRLRRWRGGSA